MNRILLIGNGFDLAHNLKTSYNDFLLWYLKQAYRIAYEEGIYKDDLLTIERKFHNIFPIGGLKNTDELITYFYSKGFHTLISDKIFKIEGWFNDFSNPFITKNKSALFETLLHNCIDCNWVDIENEYYKELKSILRTNHIKRKKNSLDELNNTLRALIIHLHTYLSTLPAANFDPLYRDILAEGLPKKPIVITPDPPITINKILILNFNYTSTIVQYLNNLGAPSELNYIHGKLNDPDHPLIFGFGDEIDKDYQQIEDEQDNRFFTYIKSFWYFKNPNYRNLTRFIDSEEYEVHILGHSCGLSDRTMLNMLFEHNNCKSIKIYYYENQQGENNFTQLTQEISRHFKDKKAMRNKIIDIKSSSPMPQVPGKEPTIRD